MDLHNLDFKTSEINYSVFHLPILSILGLLLVNSTINDTMAEDNKDESSGIRQKSKFVHVPMYQVSVDTQQKGKLLTARRKTRLVVE